MYVYVIMNMKICSKSTFMIDPSLEALQLNELINTFCPNFRVHRSIGKSY